MHLHLLIQLQLELVNTTTLVNTDCIDLHLLIQHLQPDTALRDAMQAQCVYPDWPTAFYMQSAALAKLDIHKDAADMLNEATTLKEKRQRGGRAS
jgi:hypothetical protein